MLGETTLLSLATNRIRTLFSKFEYAWTMYQRLGLVDVVAAAVSFIPLEPSGSDAEHESNGDADHLIRNEEKN